jgi:hypothetical protein
MTLIFTSLLIQNRFDGGQNLVQEVQVMSDQVARVGYIHNLKFILADAVCKAMQS